MNTNLNLEALEAEVLKLSPADRSHLLERLIGSIDADAAIEAAWEQEAERRQADIESGKASLVSGEEAMARLRESTLGGLRQKTPNPPYIDRLCPHERAWQ